MEVRPKLYPTPTCGRLRSVMFGLFVGCWTSWPALAEPVVRVPALTPESAAWSIVLATREGVAHPPAEGLRDFANSQEKTLLGLETESEEVFNASTDARLAPEWKGLNLRYWGALVPATMTLEYSKPFDLAAVGLASPLRQLGFTECTLRIRETKEAPFAAAPVESVTASLGRSLSDGFHRIYMLRPAKVQAVQLVFTRGVIGSEERVYVRDVDLWGRSGE